jgi:predicted AlkP superfamily pyrophosphatase or phosphodiesterase
MKCSKVVWIIAVALLVLVGGCFSAFAGNSKQPQFLPEKNLLLIGWDGVQWKHMQDLLKKGRLPNLAALKASGALVHVMVTDHDTSTKPGWTQICTGLSAKASGVYSNIDFRPFPRGASIYEKLEVLSEQKLLSVFIAGKAHNLGSLGPGIEWRDATIVNGRGNTMQGEPWMNAKGAFDVWYGDKNREAGEVGRLFSNVLENLGNNNRFAMFVHFGDPDAAGHEYGENSKEYRRAIIHCDAWLERIQSHLNQYGLADNTLVVVTTDHGFDEGKKTHAKAPDAFFATNDHSHHYHDGDMLDVAPTVLKLLDAPKATYQDLPGKALWE